MDLKSTTMIGHVSAFITILIWGTTFISTKILLNVFAPVEILFLRFCIGFIVLLLIYPRKLKVAGVGREIMFACAGLCGVTLYFLFENIALTYSTASNVGIIVSIAPFFTAIFAQKFLDGENLTTRFFIGFIASIAGIFLISFNGNIILQLNPTGDILAVLAAIVWAIYSILTKKISAYGYHTVQTTRRIFLYGILFMFPALLIFDFRLGLERFLQPANLFNILFLGLGASALCFVTWNFAVKRLGAIKTSVYIYIVPIVTVITSVIVLDERITGLMIVGIALTLIGLFLSESKIVFRKEKSKWTQTM